MDYIESGFDPFLSRSIDNLSQTNLDSQGPVSTAMRYDSAQVSGMLGDKLQIGNVLINGKQEGIQLIQDGLRSLVIGKDSRDKPIVKIAKPGFDAFSGSNSQLIFNSEQNVLKIVLTGSTEIGSDGSTVNWNVIPHNLGFAPIPFAFLNDVSLSGITSDANIPLPMFTNASIAGGNINFQTWMICTADINNLYIVLYNATGGGIGNLLVKWYLLQESAK